LDRPSANGGFLYAINLVVCSALRHKMAAADYGDLQGMWRV
jgi:hypothetical protein